MSSPRMSPQPEFPPGITALVKETHFICEMTADRLTLSCGKCGEVFHTENGWRDRGKFPVGMEAMGRYFIEHPCFHVRPRSDT